MELDEAGQEMPDASAFLEKKGFPFKFNQAYFACFYFRPGEEVEIDHVLMLENGFAISKSMCALHVEGDFPNEIHSEIRKWCFKNGMVDMDFVEKDKVFYFLLDGMVEEWKDL